MWTEKNTNCNQHEMKRKIKAEKEFRAVREDMFNVLRKHMLLNRNNFEKDFNVLTALLDGLVYWSWKMTGEDLEKTRTLIVTGINKSLGFMDEFVKTKLPEI